MISSVDLDVAGWSGEGEFTQCLIDACRGVGAIRFLKVEDAPASRADSGFSFISNELFVVFQTMARVARTRRFGVLPVSRTVHERALTLEGLATVLGGLDGVGEPDYADSGMLQYLRTQRIVQPYQTRAYKLVELVRIYEGNTRSTEVGGIDRNISG